MRRFGIFEALALASIGTAIVFALATGCAHVGPVPTPTPVAEVDGGFTCSTACENIFSLGCADKMPRCVPACENVAQSGVFSYDTACITRAQTCDQVTACQAAPAPK